MANAQKENIFKSINLALDYVTDKKELIYACHHSNLNFIRIICGDVDVLHEVTTVLYHFLWIHICVDEYSHIVIILTEILSCDLEHFAENVDPRIPKFITKMFKYNCRHFDKFFGALFQTEFLKLNTDVRFMTFCCQALATLNSAELQSLQPVPNDDLSAIEKN
jgi:hypothetical protein